MYASSTLTLNELSLYSHLFSSAAKNFVREGPVNDIVSRWRISNSWKLTWSASRNPSMFVLFRGEAWSLWLHYCFGTASSVINFLLQNERFVMTAHKYEFFDAVFFKFYLFFGFNAFWPRRTSYPSWIDNNLWLRFVQSEFFTELYEFRVFFKRRRIIRWIFLPLNSELWNAVFKITIIYNLQTRRPKPEIRRMSWYYYVIGGLNKRSCQSTARLFHLMQRICHRSCRRLAYSPIAMRHNMCVKCGTALKMSRERRAHARPVVVRTNRTALFYKCFYQGTWNCVISTYGR